MRLTLDFDNRKRKWVVNKKLALIRKLFPHNRIELEQSAFKKGYHIIVFNACQSFEELMHLRMLLGDDERRFYYDSKHYHNKTPHSIMFNKKGHNNTWSFGEI